LTSSWGAELEDRSLLDGRELAGIELVVCSCIVFSFENQIETKNKIMAFRERKKSGILMQYVVNCAEKVHGVI
jgi:hypothetical protein